MKLLRAETQAIEGINRKLEEEISQGVEFEQYIPHGCGGVGVLLGAALVGLLVWTMKKKAAGRDIPPTFISHLSLELGGIGAKGRLG